jgi:hypothetical protein
LRRLIDVFLTGDVLTLFSGRKHARIANQKGSLAAARSLSRRKDI